MTIRFNFERVVDAPSRNAGPARPVCLQRSIVARSRYKTLWVEITGMTEQSWSNYKRFHGDMRLLDESLEALPAKFESKQ